MSLKIVQIYVFMTTHHLLNITGKTTSIELYKKNGETGKMKATKKQTNKTKQKDGPTILDYMNDQMK